MDNKRDRSPKSPAQDAHWPQPTIEELLAMHAAQQGIHLPPTGRGHAHSGTPGPTPRSVPGYPGAPGQHPGAINLDLLATLAQSPALAQPTYTGSEIDFDRALADALRVLGQQGPHSGAHLGSAHHGSPTGPHAHLPPSFGLPGGGPSGPAPHLHAGPATLIPPQYWSAHTHGQPMAGASAAGGTGPLDARARGLHVSIPQTPATRSPPTAGPRSVGTRRAPQPLTPATAQPPEDHEEDDDQDEGVGEEDKRRRNTAASARFRAKKKQQMVNLERTISEMTGREQELEKEAADLRRENGWLKEIVMLRGKAVVNSNAGPNQDPSDRAESSKDGAKRT